jgi:effector-binding domain-containing protein
MNKLLLCFLLIISPMAAEEAFPPSPVGTPELKTLPAGLLLKSAAPGSYFDEANRLFRSLFSYISSHDIAMTTPVEAQIDGAAMYFWVAESQRAKVTGSANGVEVVAVPERRVASLGTRGGYSEENFRRTRDALAAWLRTRHDIEPAGPAYAVFWNGPFLPGFLKRFEVHVPVQDKAGFGPFDGPGQATPPCTITRRPR